MIIPTKAAIETVLPASIGKLDQSSQMNAVAHLLASHTVCRCKELFRCRFISRYRTATSEDLATRLAYGVAIGPIGFAMDRRMLLGVKERAER